MEGACWWPDKRRGKTQNKKRVLDERNRNKRLVRGVMFEQRNADIEIARQKKTECGWMFCASS
jgi:hypothetical protein